MERQNSAKSRKSKTLRSLSRSLILCNGKTSDDGSSPDEKYPNPFETPAPWTQKEPSYCPRLQLACASSNEEVHPDPLMLASMMQLREAASESCRNMRKKFFIKVGGSETCDLLGLSKSWVATVFFWLNRGCLRIRDLRYQSSDQPAESARIACQASRTPAVQLAHPMRSHPTAGSAYLECSERILAVQSCPCSTHSGAKLGSPRQLSQASHGL